jgi:hypothetical protein
LSSGTTIVISEMKRMLSIIYVNMGNCFDERSTRVTKLDLRLAEIECQRCLEL